MYFDQNIIMTVQDTLTLTINQESFTSFVLKRKLNVNLSVSIISMHVCVDNILFAFLELFLI